MADVLTIAYLTSAYARASDSFIRGEVQELRALGHTVHTFSVRRSESDEAVSDDIRREQANTEYLLDGNRAALLMSMPLVALKSPGRFFKALRLAMKTGAPGLRSRIWQIAYLAEASLLSRRLREKRVRHLHNHLGEGSATVAMLASILAGIPYSLTIHGPNEFDQPATLALHEKIKRSAFTVAVCDFGKSQLCRWSDSGDWAKIHVVRCGVNGQFLSNSPTPVPSTPRFVSIGRLAEAKGQLILVQAAGKLAAEGVSFEIVLIGDGPMRREIESNIDRLGLRDRVKLRGWMSGSQIREEILNSRAMVLPSFAEGLPVVIMESLALGRPVISTYVAGIPELIEPGVNGWLAPAGSVDALVSAMREVIAAPVDRLTEMGQAGAARVIERHNQSKNAAQIAALIEGSVSRGESHSMSS